MVARHTCRGACVYKQACGLSKLGVRQANEVGFVAPRMHPAPTLVDLLHPWCWLPATLWWLRSAR